MGGGRLVVVGPMWVEAWLRDLEALEELDYTFVDCQVEGLECAFVCSSV